MKQETESFQEVPKAMNGGLGHNRPSLPHPASLSEKNGEKPQKQRARRDKDLEFDCDAQIPPSIPEGKYEVVFLGAEENRIYGGTKVYLWFQIVNPGEWQGMELYMACNVKRKGKWGASSKFYQAWVLAAGRRPYRHDRMSTKVFRGKVFLANIRTVTTNAKNVARPLLLQYSIIDDLLERLTDSQGD